jgi:hypothetical protein
VQKCGKIETPPWWNNVTAEYRDVWSGIKNCAPKTQVCM